MGLLESVGLGEREQGKLKLPALAVGIKWVVMFCGDERGRWDQRTC